MIFKLFFQDISQQFLDVITLLTIWLAVSRSAVLLKTTSIGVYVSDGAICSWSTKLGHCMRKRYVTLGKVSIGSLHEKKICNARQSQRWVSAWEKRQITLGKVSVGSLHEKKICNARQKTNNARQSQRWVTAWEKRQITLGKVSVGSLHEKKTCNARQSQRWVTAWEKICNSKQSRRWITAWQKDM